MTMTIGTVHIYSPKWMALMKRRWDPTYFDDYMNFASLHMETWDVDPVYPILREMHKALNLDEETAIWHSLSYIAWYNMASGNWIFHNTKGPEYMTAKDYETLRVATFRRNLRGPHKMIHHYQDLAQCRNFYGSYRDWLTFNFEGDPRKDFVTCQTNVKDCWGNGVWAAHKTAEILEKVHNFPIKSSDMGGDGWMISPKPRKGLELFFGEITEREECLAGGDILYEKTLEAGLQCDIAEVETFLCDFYSLATGTFYSGKVIDTVLASLTDAPSKVDTNNDIYIARIQSPIPNYCLGEVGDPRWFRVDKERTPVYYYLKKVLDRREPTPEIPYGTYPWKRPFNSTKPVGQWKRARA